MVKQMIRMCLIFVTGLFLGTVLLEAVYLLPTDVMKKNLKRSLEKFMEEGDNPFILEGYKGSSLDNVTDAVMLNNAVFASSLPFYKAAMLAERAQNEEGDAMLALQTYVMEDRMDLSVDYSRYWHGYLVILKPLLFFFDFGQIRMLNMVVFILTLAGVTMGFLKKGMWRGCLAFFMALAGLYPMAIPYSLQYSSMFYIGMFSMLLVLYKGEYIEKKGLWASFFLAVGMCTSYMDFLTYPLFTLGMPLVLCIVLKKHGIYELIKNSFCWGIGYAGMWAGKWLTGSLLAGKNLWINALESVNLRVSGAVEDDRINRFMAVLRNFYIYWNVLGVILFIVIVAWTIYGILKYINKMTWKALLPLLAAACMPIIWYLLLANHTYIHYWYTFRILTVSIFAIAMLPEYIRSSQL